MAIQTRPPTGKVAPPLILLEGAEKSGKSWSIAELSASEKVGRTLWIDLGEGAADEYGAIPGARYEVVVHDGSWTALLENATEARELARQAHEAGEKPCVLAIDSMTQEWELLKDWATARAKRTDANKKKLQENPDAEIDVTMNFWNDANTRHRQLMAKLMTFPGIVVMTARGKETAAVDANGRPIPRRTSYSVEGQKNLGYDAGVWVRMSREHPPMVIGARSVHVGKRPGVDEPEPMPDFTLERLIFDILRYHPQSSTVRDLATPDDPELIREEALSSDVTVERLGDLWKSAFRADLLETSVIGKDDKPTTLAHLIRERAAELKAAA